MNEELRLVVNEKWNFQAKKIAGQEYLVVFPDKGTLETFSRVGSFELSIHKLKVKITKSSVDPATSSMLQTCWVRISNIPDYARDEVVAKALASLVGQPVAVDELSLVRAKPVRVKVNCRNPSAIRCSIEIFFNKVAACSVGWFISLLVREEVLLAGLCEKNIVPAGNLRSFTTSHSQTNRL